MIGGEVHYWRIERPCWERCLESAQKLGVDTIGTYVPWEFHEKEEGVYDFALLEDFIRLVEKKGFDLFIRPGPYIYAEWRNLGVPDHAAPFHKMHPEFRRKAAHWIGAVMKVLAPFFGKPITVLQADNEIDPMLHFYGEDLGFAAWLESRYKTIEAVNAAWGAEYGGFDEAMPSLVPFVDNKRFRDGCRYRYDLARDYAKWVVGEYRKHGCPVPIVLNTWPGVDAQNWADFDEAGDFFGIDIYPDNECRTGYAAFCERLRLLRSVTKTPLITEFGSGIWDSAKRTFSPDHYRLCAWTAIALGIRGWNWYMLVNRGNWTGAPINEQGVIDPKQGKAFAEAAAAFRELGPAPPPEVSCGVTWSWPANQAAEIKRLACGKEFFEAVHEMGKEEGDPLLAALHETGIEYDFVDVDRDFAGADGDFVVPDGGFVGPDAAWRKPPPILFFTGGIERTDRLWQYVEEGGHLVFFQKLVEGAAEPDGSSHPFARCLEVSIGFVTHEPVFAYRDVPGDPIEAKQLAWDVDENDRRHMETAAGRTYVTGYHERRGRGTTTVLGCAPSPEAVLALHRFLGVAIPVLPLTPGVHAARRGGKIVVLNPGEAKNAKIEVEGKILHVDLPRCSGRIVTP